jgi:hypothetical protein
LWSARTQPFQKIEVKMLQTPDHKLSAGEVLTACILIIDDGAG